MVQKMLDGIYHSARMFTTRCRSNKGCYWFLVTGYSWGRFGREPGAKASS